MPKLECDYYDGNWLCNSKYVPFGGDELLR